MRRPLVVSEISVRGSGGDDQIVVFDLAVVEDDTPACYVDLSGLVEDYPHVSLASQNPSDRPGDVARIQSGGRDLVEERLKQVMILAVDQRNSNRRAAETSGGV
jgi:hypothetical protein